MGRAFPTLELFACDGCGLKGPLPRELSFPNLRHLSVAGCHFNGAIPSGHFPRACAVLVCCELCHSLCCADVELLMLKLPDRRLPGGCLQHLCQNICRVIDYNKAACCTEWGTGGFPKLEYFSVFHCASITGALPASWTLPNLWRIDASGASFTGTGLPPQWGEQLPGLKHVEIEGSNLTGQRSSDWSSC